MKGLMLDAIMLFESIETVGAFNVKQQQTEAVALYASWGYYVHLAYDWSIITPGDFYRVPRGLLLP